MMKYYRGFRKPVVYKSYQLEKSAKRKTRLQNHRYNIMPLLFIYCNMYVYTQQNIISGYPWVVRLLVINFLPLFLAHPQVFAFTICYFHN